MLNETHKMKKIYFLFIVLLVISSCKFPEHYFTKAPKCNPSTIINQQKDILNPENQTTLKTFIKEKLPKDFRYFFKTFINNTDYMVVNFRNEVSCFDIKILVNNWEKLNGMRKVNGKSYPKELYELTWKIKNINNHEEVVYVNMHDIID